MPKFVKEFLYKKADGSESRRKVLALSEDTNRICGLDLGVLEAKLGAEEVDKAIKCIEDYNNNLENKEMELTESNNQKTVYPNYNPDWNVAYRYFKTSGMSPILDNSEDIDLGVLKGE